MIGLSYLERTIATTIRKHFGNEYQNITR